MVVQSLFNRCSILVQWLFNVCSMLGEYLFNCSILGEYLFNICSIDCSIVVQSIVQCLFDCSMLVQCLFNAFCLLCYTSCYQCKNLIELSNIFVPCLFFVTTVTTRCHRSIPWPTSLKVPQTWCCCRWRSTTAIPPPPTRATDTTETTETTGTTGSRRRCRNGNVPRRRATETPKCSKPRNPACPILPKPWRTLHPVFFNSSISATVPRHSFPLWFL